MKKTTIFIALALLISAGSAKSEDFTLTRDGYKLSFDITKQGSASNEGEAMVTFYGDFGSDDYTLPANTNVKIPEKINHLGTIYRITEIGKKSFKGQNGLKSVKIPATVGTIEPFAFENCCNLLKIDFADEEVKIDEDAFFGCNNLNEINFGKWNSIDLTPFRWSEALKQIPLPFTVKEIRGLKELPSLESVEIEIGNEKYYSNEGILYDKDKTTLIFVPGGRKDKLIIPAGTKEIAENALENCFYVTEIVIPASVEKIHPRAFIKLDSLETLNIDFGNLLVANNIDAGMIPDFLHKPLLFSNKKVELLVPKKLSKVVKTVLDKVNKNGLADGEYLLDSENIKAIIES